MNKRAFAVLVVVMASALSGCNSTSSESKILPESAPVVIFDRSEREVRALTASGDGFLGSDYEYIPVGTSALVMEDSGSEQRVDRGVKLAISSGSHAGLVVIVPRRNVRPR